jgi:hypothetical protein
MQPNPDVLYRAALERQREGLRQAAQERLASSTLRGKGRSIMEPLTVPLVLLLCVLSLLAVR